MILVKVLIDIYLFIYSPFFKLQVNNTHIFCGLRIYLYAGQSTERRNSDEQKPDEIKVNDQESDESQAECETYELDGFECVNKNECEDDGHFEPSSGVPSLGIRKTDHKFWSEVDDVFTCFSSNHAETYVLLILLMDEILHRLLKMELNTPSCELVGCWRQDVRNTRKSWVFLITTWLADQDDRENTGVLATLSRMPLFS